MLALLDTIINIALFIYIFLDFIQVDMFDFLQQLLQTEGIRNLEIALGLVGAPDESLEGVVDVLADLGPEH